MKRTTEILPAGLLKGKLIGTTGQSKQGPTIEIYSYLRDKLATLPMIIRDTHYSKSLINKAIKDLEKAESVWYVEQRICPVTRTTQWYLTTDPTKAGRNFIQQKLWDGEIT